MKQSDTAKSKHEVNRDGTIDLVLDLIMEHLPTATEDCEQFLVQNKNFVSQLLKKTNISEELGKYVPRLCNKCGGKVDRWQHKPKTSFVISLGEIKTVTIPVKQCVNCYILLYPQLFHVGLVPLHNKESIRFENVQCIDAIAKMQLFVILIFLYSVYSISRKFLNSPAHFDFKTVLDLISGIKTSQNIQWGITNLILIYHNHNVIFLIVCNQ